MVKLANLHLTYIDEAISINLLFLSQKLSALQYVLNLVSRIPRREINIISVLEEPFASSS